MSKRRYVQRQKILANIHKFEFSYTIPGPPLIYSLGFKSAGRHLTEQYWQIKNLRTMLRCCFESVRKSTYPVVLKATFYVTPPQKEAERFRKCDIASETIPAAAGYEVMEYTLHLMHIIHTSLILSYRQIVKVDVEKFYSNNPRTIFTFLHYDQYENYNNTSDSKSEGEHQVLREAHIQPKPKRDEDSAKSRKKTDGAPRTLHRTPDGRFALQDPHTSRR